jgi:hypothetical protein
MGEIANLMPHCIFSIEPADSEANTTTLAEGGITATPAMFSDKIISQI